MIRQTGYRHQVKVDFVMYSPKVYIRPDNALSRALSKLWVKCLLWFFLIYPFVWLFKRFNSRGGGRWKVCGCTYALKSWRATTEGTWEAVGLREQDWLQWNQGIIQTAVINRVRA